MRTNDSYWSHILLGTNKYVFSDGKFMYTAQISGTSITIPGSLTSSGNAITLSARGAAYKDVLYVMHNTDGKIAYAGIIKIDGGISWIGFRVLQLQSGEVLLIGQVENTSSSGSTGSVTVSVDSTHSQSGSPKSFTIKPDLSRGYSSQLVFAKLTSSGKVSYLNQFAPVGQTYNQTESIESIIPASDNGYYMLYTQQYTYQFSIPSTMTSSGTAMTVSFQRGVENGGELLIKFNSSGKVEWTRSLSYSMIQNGATSVLTTYNGSITPGPSGEFIYRGAFFGGEQGYQINIPSTITASGSQININVPYIPIKLSTDGSYINGDLIATFNSSGKLMNASVIQDSNINGTSGANAYSMVKYNQSLGQYILYSYRQYNRYIIPSCSTSNGVSYDFNHFTHNNYMIMFNRQGKVTSAYEYGGLSTTEFGSYFNSFDSSFHENKYNGGQPIINYSLKNGNYILPSSLTTNGVSKTITSNKTSYYSDIMSIKYNANGKIASAITYKTDSTGEVKNEGVFEETNGVSHLFITFKKDNLTITDELTNSQEIIAKQAKTETFGLIKRNVDGTIANKFFAGSENYGSVNLIGMYKTSAGKYIVLINSVGEMHISKKYTRCGLNIIIGKNKNYYSSILILGSDYKLEEIISYEGLSKSYENYLADDSANKALMTLNNGDIMDINSSSGGYKVCAEATTNNVEIKHDYNTGFYSGLSYTTISSN